MNSVNSPMNKRFQANDHQLAFEIVKFEIVGFRKCGGCLRQMEDMAYRITVCYGCCASPYVMNVVHKDDNGMWRQRDVVR